MKTILLCVFLMLGFLPTTYGWAEGDVRAESGCTDSAGFLCLSSGVEDLVRIPQTDWVVASGQLRAIDVRRRAVLPLVVSESRFAKTLYRDCPGPLTSLDAAGEQLHTHGLNIRPGSRGKHTLYVVHHGSRESVEVFEISLKAGAPYLVWVGCAVAPPNVMANGVAPLPGGGFAITNFSRTPLKLLLSPAGADARAKFARGEGTGEAWEWTSAEGWKILPGTQGSGLNGIEASRDGKWIYLNEWATKKVLKVSRGADPVIREEAKLDFMPDNIRWQRDGTLFSAGQDGTTDAVLNCAITKDCRSLSMSVARIDPATMESHKLVDRIPATPAFGMGTAALAVDHDLWLSALIGSEIIIRPLKQR